MNDALSALPQRWRRDRLLCSDRRAGSSVQAVGDDEAIVLVRREPGGPLVDGFGRPAVLARLLDGLIDGGLRAPLSWMTMPVDVALSPDVCVALDVTPRPGWDFLSVDAPLSGSLDPRVVPLDAASRAQEIRACLAAANPDTEADPSRADETGWWGVAGPDGLEAVLGAGLRGGATVDAFSWHLHGLGVRPQARRAGLGAALMAVATSAGFAAGADWVSLGMWADNHGARRVYERLGFHTDHRRRSYRPTGTARPPR